MGKHSAQHQQEATHKHEQHARPENAAAPISGTERPASSGPLPASLAQTAALGAIAVLIVVVVLIWSGVEARTAAAAGIGLLALGVIAVLVVHRAGLLRNARRAGGRPGG